MQYKCKTCYDTGSRDQIGTYLDCNECGVAQTRRDLNDFVKSLGPTHPEDVALAIHQRALAIGLADAVEGVLTEMQLGGALHMPQEPVAHLKYWAAQRWSGCGDHEIEHGEGLEVCEPGEIGADGQPAFPVFMHSIPGALAMAPKQEAPRQWVAIKDSAWVNIVNHDHAYDGWNKDDIINHVFKLTEAKCKELNGPGAAPASANGAPELPPPFFYYESNEDGSVEWNDGCVCQDDVYTNAEYAKENGTHGGKVYSEAQMRAALSGAKGN